MNTLSQAGQDIFAAYINEFKRDGYFLDLGANEPFTCNNTAILESELGWRGILVDFLPNLVELCAASRKESVSLCADLEKKSVEEILTENNAPPKIDYLSLDIDYETPRIACLKSIDFQKRFVSCMTFEHDRYLIGDNIMNISRQILQDNNMVLLCPNVKFNGWDFEDWYIHKDLAEDVRIKKIAASGADYRQIISSCLN